MCATPGAKQSEPYPTAVQHYFTDSRRQLASTLCHIEISYLKWIGIFHSSHENKKSLAQENRSHRNGNSL